MIFFLPKPHIIADLCSYRKKTGETHQGEVARDRHASPPKVISRSSSSQNPTSSPIYAALERKPEKHRQWKRMSPRATTSAARWARGAFLILDFD